jgi:hypothetical protein
MNYQTVSGTYSAVHITDDVILFQSADPDQTIPLSSISKLEFIKPVEGTTYGEILITLLSSKTVNIFFDAKEEPDFFEFYSALDHRQHELHLEKTNTAAMLMRKAQELARKKNEENTQAAIEQPQHSSRLLLIILIILLLLAAAALWYFLGMKKTAGTVLPYAGILFSSVSSL